MIQHSYINLEIVSEKAVNNIISLRNVPHYFEDNHFTPDLLDTELYDDEKMKYLMIGIVQNVAVEMDKQQYTIGSLARATGISSSHISRILSCKQDIGLKTLIKIACALHVNPAALFPIDNNTRKSNGQRFDEIVRGIPLQYSNYFLDIVAGLCNLYKKDNENISLYGNQFDE